MICVIFLRNRYSLKREDNLQRVEDIRTLNTDIDFGRKTWNKFLLQREFVGLFEWFRPKWPFYTTRTGRWDSVKDDHNRLTETTAEKRWKWQYIRGKISRIWPLNTGSTSNSEFVNQPTRRPLFTCVAYTKNRSAMRTCVAYEIELLFSLIGFLLEELISEYH